MTLQSIAKPVVAPSIKRPLLNFDPDEVASLAVECLTLELETWPKPGLVSHVDTGSHTDMDANTFRASANAIRPCFRSLATAGADGCQMPRLRSIGLEGEMAMALATGGVNTHRGAIFGLGLLCAAVGARSAGVVDTRLPLGRIVAKLWGDDILGGPRLIGSHGAAAWLRYGAGGARAEAAAGFPTIYKVALPAIQLARSKSPLEAEAIRVETCFALISEMEDTNLLHRGGQAGLVYARSAAKEFLAAGGISSPLWRQRAEAIHREFISRSLSPGGAADLLAMALFVDSLETEAR
jgi:triphosphoribosyl-dephospho-CoA synthase